MSDDFYTFTVKVPKSKTFKYTKVDAAAYVKHALQSYSGGFLPENPLHGVGKTIVVEAVKSNAKPEPLMMGDLTGYDEKELAMNSSTFLQVYGPAAGPNNGLVDYTDQIPLRRGWRLVNENWLRTLIHRKNIAIQRSAQAAGGVVVIGYQYRFGKGGRWSPWHDCDKATALRYTGRRENDVVFEVRTLLAQQQQQQQQEEVGHGH